MKLTYQKKGSVSYTEQGSPTVTNGVASGFSASDYLMTSSVFSSLQKLELFVRIKNPASFDGARGICGASTYTGNLGVMRYGNGTIASILAVIDENQTSQYRNLNLSYPTTASTEYDIYACFDVLNHEVTLKLFNLSGTLLAETSLSYPATDTVRLPQVYQIGATQYGAFEGSIDLNHTYIKVNGQAWFGKCPVEVKHINYGTSVGYTKVGSPTISNAVLTNPSNSNYAQLSQNFDSSKDYELQYKFKFYEWQTGSRCLQLTANYFGGLDITRYYIAYHAGKNSSNAWCKVDKSYTFSLNTDYWVRITKNGNEFKMYISTNGTDFSLERTVSFDDISYDHNMTIGIGRQESGKTFAGEIDLNESYIKIDGKRWFSCQAVQSVTCNGTTVWSVL